jgi:hypothetical protein
MEEEARGAKLHHRDPEMSNYRNGETGTRFFILNPTVQVKLNKIEGILLRFSV